MVLSHSQLHHSSVFPLLHSLPWPYFLALLPVPSCLFQCSYHDASHVLLFQANFVPSVAILVLGEMCSYNAILVLNQLPATTRLLCSRLGLLQRESLHFLLYFMQKSVLFTTVFCACDILRLYTLGRFTKSFCRANKHMYFIRFHFLSPKLPREKLGITKYYTNALFFSWFWKRLTI